MPPTSRSRQLNALPFTLLSIALAQPDGRIFGELTLSLCDDNLGSAAAYIRIRNHEVSDSAYHLVYDGQGVSLTDSPQLIPVNLVRLDGSPALTGHYMVDLLPVHD